MSEPDPAELALTALARDLIEEISAGRALELAAQRKNPASPGGGRGVIDTAYTGTSAPAARPPAKGVLPEIPEPKKGAGAVHPQLGGNLVKLPGDTISGHAHAHVPQMWPVAAPDARDTALGEAHAALDSYRQADLARMAEEQAAAKAQRTGIPAPGTYQPLDDGQYAAHVSGAADAVGQALAAGQGSSQAQALDGHGQVWAPQRAAQHNEIVQQIMDKAAAVPGEGHAVIAGGLPGRAKDMVVRQALADGRHALVSHAAIKAEMAKRGMIAAPEGLSAGESSALVHHEAGHVANLALARLSAARKNLLFDTPAADAGTMRRHIGRLRGSGYSVHGMLTHVPAEKAAQAAARAHRKGLESYRQGSGPGPGQGADTVAGAETGPGRTANSDAFEQLKPDFDSWEQHDAAKGKPVLAGQGGQRADHGITSVEDLMKETRR